MKDIFIKDKFNREVAALEFKSPIHEKVILTKHNYFTHIINTHPEIDLKIVQAIVEVPDKIYEVLKEDKLFYYEKIIQEKIYILVLGEKVKGDYKKVLTAFELTDYDKNKFNRVHCIYDVEELCETEDKTIEKLEEDKDFFYKLFDI